MIGAIRAISDGTPKICRVLAAPGVELGLKAAQSRSHRLLMNPRELSPKSYSLGSRV